MEKFIYYNELLDIYKGFLTDKNSEIMNYYYRENLSLSEISEIMGVSRSFIGTSIKNSEKKLVDLEKKLRLKEKKEKLSNLLNSSDIEKIKKEIEEIIKG